MPEQAEETSELEKVQKQRRAEALGDGMSLAEARMFAESEIDVGELRRLVEQGCPEELLARILL